MEKQYLAEMGFLRDDYEVNAACLSVILSKCQMNRLRKAFLAPKYESVSKTGILGRFAKYTLM